VIEQPTVTVLVSRELLKRLGEWSESVRVKVVETPGVGTGWEMIAQTHECSTAGDQT
jgi:hypothetical protein